MNDKKEKITEFNKKITNPIENIDNLKGIEEIIESFTYIIEDIYGRNTLLSITYQIGADRADDIVEKIKKKVRKDEFGIYEALISLFEELRDLFSIKILDIIEEQGYITVTIENYC